MGSSGRGEEDGDGGRTYGKERKTDVKMDLCIKY